MRDASNELTDMNMSERHVGKSAAFSINIMFAAKKKMMRYSSQNPVFERSRGLSLYHVVVALLSSSSSKLRSTPMSMRCRI